MKLNTTTQILDHNQMLTGFIYFYIFKFLIDVEVLDYIFQIREIFFCKCLKSQNLFDFTLSVNCAYAFFNQKIQFKFEVRFKGQK